MINIFRRQYVGVVHCRSEAQSVVDYFDGRMAAGDPLLDQWMPDSYEAAKEIIRQLDILEACGWRTGITKPAKENQ